MSNNKIYTSMVIRSQEETIKLQEKEIERLNNIINELEEWLKEKIDEYKDMELYDNASMFEYALNELNELKGDGSNE